MLRTVKMSFYFHFIVIIILLLLCVHAHVCMHVECVLQCPCGKDRTAIVDAGSLLSLLCWALQASWPECFWVILRSAFYPTVGGLWLQLCTYAHQHFKKWLLGMGLRSLGFQSNIFACWDVLSALLWLFQSMNGREQRKPKVSDFVFWLEQNMSRIPRLIGPWEISKADTRMGQA